MKKHILNVIYISLLSSFTALISYSFIADTDKTAAKVSQMQGLSIFILSTPAAAYDYQGSVTKKLAWTGEPQEMLNGIIKKVKNDYPDADGIIFTSVDMKKADAIKFK